tara:strand:+ start:1126 stop:3561 length:2436 start_codon:yes stop_codon:yes gene_type:complete
MALFDTIRAGASGAADDYEIDRSLRFNSSDSANMHREGGSSGNQRTFTVSVWIKRSTLAEHSFWDFYTNDANRTIFQIYFGQLRIFSREGNSTQMSLQTDSEMKLRDFSAWYHFMYAVDTTQSTSTNRVKIYINGEQQTLNGSYPSQNAETFVGSNNENRIGCQHDSAGNEAFFNGYMAEFNYIDGSQLAPSDFAETDAVTGEYKPIEYSGSYGTKGYYINFSDNSSTSNLGTDFSGNGNNFTSVSGFSVSSGVSNDSVTDTPTNNWCVLNPASRFQGQPPQDGNLRFFGQGGGDGSVVGTHKLESGKKYYWEFEYTETGGGSQCPVGITDDFFQKEFIKGGSTTGMFAFDFRGGAGTPGAKDEGSVTNFGSRPSSGDICGIALDLSAGKMYAHKANSYYNSGNPDNGTGAVITGIPTDRDYLMHVSVDAGGGGNETFFRFNFGQQGFSHQPSTFTDVLNSANIDEPTIPKGSKYFDALLYTGNGSNSHAITGLDFSPDWVWIKGTSGTNSHAVFDTVRGATKRLGNASSGLGNTTESTVAASLKSFDSNGFTFGNENGNNNGENYVAWCWDAGTSTASNTNGGITTQVRANTTAGFSIISYTGTGSQNTVGHGLGVKPKIIITKNRSSSQDWFFYSKQITGNGATYIKFNTSDSEASDAHTYPNVEPTSTVYTIGGNDGGDGTNGSGKTYIAYAFAEIEGFSAIGQFDGNGNSDGTFVYTGLRPRYLMIRRTNSGNHWVIYDSARSTFNVIDDFLRADTNDGNSTSSQVNVDFLSNGFKMRSGFDIVNAGSGTYFYMAFAENAFKYARAF